MWIIAWMWSIGFKFNRYRLTREFFPFRVSSQGCKIGLVTVVSVPMRLCVSVIQRSNGTLPIMTHLSYSLSKQSLKAACPCPS